MNKQDFETLQARARKLTLEMAYVSEYNRLCSVLIHNTEQLLKLMDENQQKDSAFGELIAQVNGAAHAKVQLGDSWIIENRAKLDRYTSRLAEESISDA